MASCVSSLLCLVLFLSLSGLSNAHRPSSTRPHALVLPVTKDVSTKFYLTEINQRTPLIPTKLVVDLGGQSLTIGCENGYKEKSDPYVSCGSVQCLLARSNRCVGCIPDPGEGCGSYPCGVYTTSVTDVTSDALLASDVVSIQSTNGSYPVGNFRVTRFLFGCARFPILTDELLAKGVRGIAGLGITNISMPSQFSYALKSSRKFAICLSSSNGVIFFGESPYFMQPGIELSTSLVYTPIFVNPFSTTGYHGYGFPSSEYFIGVKSIKINGKLVDLKKELLTINKENGNGGTKISTTKPYTIMETSIYKAFTNTFVNQAKVMNITRVRSVEPFGACFSSKNILSTRVGPSVPTIDLVLPPNNKVIWRIFGSNSMVRVNDNVLCLGFVDGGEYQVTSIVIGGYQLEDNLLQFDVEKSRLGFSSSLLGVCKNRPNQSNQTNPNRSSRFSNQTKQRVVWYGCRFSKTNWFGSVSGCTF